MWDAKHAKIAGTLALGAVIAAITIVATSRTGREHEQRAVLHVAPVQEIDRLDAAFDADEDGIPDFRDACLRSPRGTQVDSHGCPPPPIPSR